jgi:hypothetical protein
MSAPRRTFLTLMGALAFSAACGPIQSTAFLIDAETMLEEARAAQATRLTPYEWTAASLYYSKAREEVGYSDYEQAVDYARKAVEFATRARDGALKAARKAEGAPPLQPPPVGP